MVMKSDVDCWESDENRLEISLPALSWESACNTAEDRLLLLPAMPLVDTEVSVMVVSEALEVEAAAEAAEGGDAASE